LSLLRMTEEGFFFAKTALTKVRAVSLYQIVLESKKNNARMDYAEYRHRNNKLPM
jgi:aminopeptidase-like protein